MNTHHLDGPEVIARLDDDGLTFTVIDYSTETGPFWLVEIDGTLMLPDRPLPLEHAIAAFRREVADADRDDEVCLVQCDEATLRWAGVPIRDEDDDEQAENEASA
jgi:hypothetical protein